MASKEGSLPVGWPREVRPGAHDRTHPVYNNQYTDGTPSYTHTHTHTDLGGDEWWGVRTERVKWETQRFTTVCIDRNNEKDVTKGRSTQRRA